MDTLAIAYAYEYYEESQGSEYELADFYDFGLLSNIVWLTSGVVLILVSQMLLVKTAIAKIPTPAEPIYNATVSVNSCLRTRQVPSLAGEIERCLPNRTVLKPIVREENGWYQLADGNWVFKEFVTIPQSVPVPAPSTPNSCNQELLKYVAGNLMQCDEIRVLQEHLNWYQLLSEDVPVTGVFDLATKVAVETFQTKRKLTVDGIVGQETRRELEM